MREHLRNCLAFALLVVCALVAPLAHAQYPNRPITLVVPFPAGSASDLSSRVLASSLAATLGQAVVVQNRPGGNSAIGAAAVASAAPDGYTLLIASVGTVALPYLVKGVAFDPLKDLTPIAAVGRFVLQLYVNAELPVHNLAELIEYAQKHPGTLNYASGNVTSIAATAQLLTLAGDVKITHVPYKGEPEAMVDLAANRVQVMFSTPSSADGFVRSGKIRAIATGLPQRSAEQPALPSINETYPGFSVTAWTAVMGPKGLPHEVVERLSGAVNAALSRPETREKLMALRVVPVASAPAEFATFVREQYELYGRVLRDAGVLPQ
jgi:tripartite-type tricarboxylate transporter receptor subunit TctC